MVSRSTWFRHKTADLLARKHLPEDNNDLGDLHTDPLYVPPGEIDLDLVTELQASSLLGTAYEMPVLSLLQLCFRVYFVPCVLSCVMSCCYSENECAIA